MNENSLEILDEREKKIYRIQSQNNLKEFFGDSSNSKKNEISKVTKFLFPILTPRIQSLRYAPVIWELINFAIPFLIKIGPLCWCLPANVADTLSGLLMFTGIHFKFFLMLA